jgi:hypothetical protein
MVIEALKAARDFIESDRQSLAESLTVNGEIVFEDDIDRGAMAEYVNVLVVIDGALKAAQAQESPFEIGQRLRREGRGISDLWGAVGSDADVPEAHRGYDHAAQPAAVQPMAHIVGEIDHTGKVWKPVQPAPVQQEPVACHICGGQGFIKCDALQSREKNNGKWGRCLNCQPYTTPPAAQPAPVRHNTNAWAEMAANGLQWVRNIVDGASDPMVALANLEENLKHCEAATTPPAQPAPVPLTDEQIESLLPDDDTPMSLGEAFVKFARLVEAHHGITKGQP